jgi:hypothetical protein
MDATSSKTDNEAWQVLMINSAIFKDIPSRVPMAL